MRTFMDFRVQHIYLIPEKPGVRCNSQSRLWSSRFTMFVVSRVNVLVTSQCDTTSFLSVSPQSCCALWCDSYQSGALSLVVADAIKTQLKAPKAPSLQGALGFEMNSPV